MHKLRERKVRAQFYFEFFTIKKVCFQKTVLVNIVNWYSTVWNILKLYKMGYVTLDQPERGMY